MLRLPLLLVASTFAVAAAAQDSPQPSAARANTEAAARIAEAQAAQADVAADAQAGYAADLAAYDAALARHDARVDRQAEHYRHQQRAYADAMRDWRAQDYACRHGSNRACIAPSPDPADYW